jgi:hypothetical protein
LCGLFAAFIGLTLVSRFAPLSDQTRLQLADAVLVGSGAALALGAAWTFVAARGRELIGAPTVYVASSMWAALGTLTVFGWAQQPAKSLPACVLFLGVMALAVAPLAAAPLALHWNRHR